MHRISTRQSVAIFVGIVGLSVLLWFLLARQMPLRHFAWLCFLAGAFIAMELTVAKNFAERIKQNRGLGILLELILGSIFVATFYWFAVYVYPGTR